jgi:crossover junction endodeoxyribonuclease RuvC
MTSLIITPMQTAKKRIVVGIDPGLADLGYGFIELTNNNWQALAFGSIKTDKKLSAGERLVIISSQLNTLLDLYKPTEAAIESLYFAQNTTTAFMVGQARGVAILELAKRQLPIKEINPQVVKQSICGYGAAKKPQIGAMVKILLKLDKVPKPDDAADALAIALTGAQLR